MSKIDIAVVDYGMGNLRSVSKALEHVAEGQSVVVTSDPEVISQAARVVFLGKVQCRIVFVNWMLKDCEPL